MATTREFFLTEARDCLERLTALADASDDSMIEAGELHRIARALRGSAQMAREVRVQTVAYAIEVAARTLVQGGIAWGQDLRALLQGTLADLAALVAAEEDEARLEERAVEAVERWERHGLELPPLPDPAPAPAAPPPHAAGPAGASDGAAPEDLPVEVVNFFRTEAGALVDRIERLAEEPGARHGSGRRELMETVTALRDLASTFGFGHSAAVAERLMDAVEQERPAVGLLADVRRLVTSELPGQPIALTPGAAARRPQRRGPARPSAAPAAAPADGAVVPIDELLYRGEAALRRALELRPAIDRAVGDHPSAREAVEELFDLIRLGLS